MTAKERTTGLPPALHDYTRLLEAETRMADGPKSKAFDDNVRTYLRKVEGLVDRDKTILQAIRDTESALREVFKAVNRNTGAVPAAVVENSKLAALEAIGNLKAALQDATPSVRAPDQGLGW